MLSRLSGLANTVLHELSGDGDDGDPGATDTGPGAAPIPGSSDDPPEDVLERLAQTEQLVVHLKTLIREKDVQLQQKDASSKEERDLADVKLAKLKLQAKAKMASLNKQIEELKKSAPVSGGQAKSAAKESQELRNGQDVSEELRAELEALKSHLLEKDTLVQALQETISGQKEELDSAKDLESKHAKQIHSLQEEINMKDFRFQELVQQHEEELKQLTARSDARLQEQFQQFEAMQQQLAERSNAGADMQQTLKTLQRKQEEQEEALLGRTRVVELLQQELQNADQQKQILSQQFREMEAELNSVKVELDSEKQTSKSIVERLEGELTNKETSISSLQGELQGLSTEFQQVRLSQAELELIGPSRDEMHRQEVQSLTEALEQARRMHEVVQWHPSEETHIQEVQSLMDALEQARRDHTQLELLGNSRDEQLRTEVQTLTESLEQARRDHAELERQGSSRDEKHRAEVQSMTDTLEQARRTLTDLELEKSIWKAKQKEMGSLTVTSEQSEVAHVEEPSDCMKDEIDGQDSVIPQLLTKREELLAACRALEVRKEELVQEVDRQSVQCEDLNQKIENLQAMLISSQDSQEASTVPLVTAEDAIQPSKDGMLTVCESLVTTEEGREIILTKTAELRSKELSILMLDLKDAQMEISRMKSELPEIEEIRDGSSRQDFQVQGSMNKEATSQLKIEGEFNMEAMFHTETQRVEQMIVKEQSVSEISTSTTYIESLENTLHQKVQTSRSTMHLESNTYTSDESSGNQVRITESPAVDQSFTEVPDHEWQKLQIQVLHLQEAEHAYKRELEEREAQIKQLKELVIEHKEKTEKKDDTGHTTMKVEEEQPAQVMGITEHLNRLQWNLADAEKERLSDYESSTMQHSLLGEQISSLENESKSKDLKIEALQKDLDQIQLQLCDQISLVKRLGVQLQAKEEEVNISETRLQDSLTKLEELSQRISMKEVEAAASEQVLSQNAKDIESLHEALAEKDLQAAEISHSMSEKMVLLNEEKFSLMNDLKALKKELDLLNESKKVDDELVKNGGDGEGLALKSPEHLELLEVIATLRREKEEREFHVENMRHENLQLQQERDEFEHQLETLRSNQVNVEKREGAEVLQSSDKHLDQEEHQRLTEKITLLEKEMEELQVQLQISKEMQLHVSKTKEMLERERGEHGSQLDSLQNEQFLQQSEIVRLLEVEREELQIQLEALNDSRLQQDEKLATLQSENIDLLGKLETLKSQEILLQDTIVETLQVEKEQLQIQLETLRNEHLCQDEVLETLGGENKALLNQQKTLGHEKHVEKGETLEVLRRENGELQFQLDALRKDILQRDGMTEILQQEKAELLDHLEKLKTEHLQQDEQIVSLDLEKEATGSEQFQQTAGVKGKDELHAQLKEQKKENEQMKRKLQAALLNRKELMKKVDVLEKEMRLLGGQPKGEELIKDVMEDAVVTESQKMEVTLIQQLSEKELELQNAKQDLVEKAANEEKLQALIKEVTFELQDKTCLVESLKVELLQNQSIIQKLTAITEEHANSSTATVPDSPSIGTGPAHELQTSVLENKISSLEQEKEQLQKKVQETLASRKNTIKKAQEKDRHHREQLKQQKEEYNLLQERFDEQNQHQVSIQEQLLELQKELEAQRLSQSQTDTVAVLPVSSEETIHVSQISLQDSLWGQEWVEFTSSEVEDTLKRTDNFQGEPQPTDQYSLELEKAQTQKAALEMQLANVEDELLQKSGVVQQLQEQIVQTISDLESSKHSYSEAQDTISHLKLELGNCQDEILRLEELRNLQPQIEEMKTLLSLQNGEKDRLSLLLGEKDEALESLQNMVLEKEDLVKALQTQLENLAKDHDEKSKRLQTEVFEVQQKQEEEAEESKSKQQVQRKLQAALISRKEALKESKSLKEQLGSARNTIEELSIKLTVMESDLSNVIAEKGNILQDSASLQEERDKLIAEINRTRLENQNLVASCESLKLALEGITQEKESLKREIEMLQNSQATENSEWQDKHKELQKEYETLLQSYENVSNETERIQRVMETIRQEKQELFNKMKVAEAQKKEVDKQLEEAEHEMDGMKEKMRKFAKSKQQKILELEEENEKLHAELHPTHSEQIQTEDGSVRENANLKKELERLQSENDTLISRFSAVNDENAALCEEVQHFKKLQHKEAPVSGSAEVKESGHQDLDQEDVVVIEAVALPTTTTFEALEERITKDTSLEASIPVLEQAILKSDESSSHDEINLYIQQISQLQKQILNLEDKKLEMEHELSRWKADFQTLTEDRKEVETHLFTSNDEVKALHKTIADLETKNSEIREKLDKITKQKDIIEAEKDDLEERLMNQLAELNGSIGNYQQDATDFQAKSDNLELELQSFQIRISELEEENRQLERKKRDAESQMQKEYTEKLKSVQTGERGRKTHAKELQELLREKQLEVKHLQKDCIGYQEKISGLERTVKALEFVQSESLKEQSATKQSLVKVVEERKKAHAELASFKVLLDDTQSETARVLAESLKLKEELQTSKESAVSQMKKKDEELERRIEQERDKNTKEIKNMQEKLDALQREKDHLEGTLLDLQGSLDKKNRDTKELQGSLNESLAKLAAFTRSMSSLQDDRDRIIDESKKWENKFTSAIQKKEQEIQAKEEACQVLKDKAKQMSILIEELQIKVSRLEHDVLDWESKLHTKEESHQTSLESLQLENEALVSQLEDSQKLHRDCQEELAKLNGDVTTQREQLTELANNFSKSESTKQELQGVAKEMESEIQNYKFSCEQLQADLQASKDLTNKLHDEVETKDQNIMRLLAAKEEAVSAATTELLHQHSNEVKDLENKLIVEAEEKQNLETERSKLQDRLKALTAKMKTVKEQGKEHKDRLDSFTKSMSSLQDDRDRVLEEYKQLEDRHLSAILDKDQLIQEAAAENNKLKEEIRSLHSGIDDLNSENAKLAAELVRYREDLNQVITLKDSQQKQLLKAQLEQIHNLGEEKSTLEKQLRDSVTAVEELQKTINDLQQDKQRVANEAETLQLCVSQLNDELATLKGSGLLYELEVKLQEKEREVEGLSSELLVLQDRITELEENSLRIQSEADQKVAHLSEKHAKELKSLHHDAGIMRNETETAEVRVAELAKDLMEMEQRYLSTMEENEDLKAQVLAFGKSMSSLQDSRDEAEGELEELQKKYSSDHQIQEAVVKELQKDLDQLRGEHSLLIMERDSLDAQLTSLKGNTVEQSLLSQVEQLNKQLMSKDDEVAHLSSELDSYSTQVKSFSKAMGSLQDERDRLLSELDKQRKVEDEKQQSAPSPAQVQSMKNALSSLQNDRDRLLKELKNLQQQYLRIGEETGDIAQLKIQLNESRQQLEVQLSLQEQMRQETSFLQQELLGLREEKMSYESHTESLKKQYLAELEDKGQQLIDLQRLLQEARSPSFKSKLIEEQYQRQALPETASTIGNGAIKSLDDETVQLQTQLSDSLKQMHQKELRIQQLNSKLSQIFEEKNSLSIQLRGSSQYVRESQLRYNEVLKHCTALEAQLQELQSQLKEPVSETGEPMTDAAPGAPQEKTDPKDEAYSTQMKEVMLRLSEAQQHQISSDQELQRLEELLSHEREQRLAAEEALFSSENQIRRLESSHWAPAQDHSYDVSASHEHSLLIEPLEGTFSKTRSDSRLKRLLQYFFYSRTRTPMLVTAYLLTVHILLILCLTGYL